MTSACPANCLPHLGVSVLRGCPYSSPTSALETLPLSWWHLLAASSLTALSASTSRHTGPAATSVSSAKSPSSFEDETVAVIKEFCSGWADVKMNSLMNALIYPKDFSGTKPALMLDAHGDEVGSMVRSIHSNGTMGFVEFGRFSPHVLAGQDVYVRTTEGQWVLAVIGVKLPHFMSEAERVSGTEELILDLRCHLEGRGCRVLPYGHGRAVRASDAVCL